MARKPTETEAVDQTTGEVVNVPATVATDFAAPAVEGQGFKRVRTLAVPVLPFPDGATIQCRITKPAHDGKAIEGGAIKQVARLLEIESRTGQKRFLIANKVLERELEEGYPKATYVGRVFLISRQAPKAGKRYPTYLIEEIEWV